MKQALGQPWESVTRNMQQLPRSQALIEVVENRGARGPIGRCRRLDAKGLILPSFGSMVLFDGWVCIFEIYIRMAEPDAAEALKFAEEESVRPSRTMEEIRGGLVDGGVVEISAALVELPANAIEGGPPDPQGDGGQTGRGGIVEIYPPKAAWREPSVWSVLVRIPPRSPTWEDHQKTLAT